MKPKVKKIFASKPRKSRLKQKALNFMAQYGSGPPEGVSPDLPSDFFSDLAAWRLHFKILLFFLGFACLSMPALAQTAPVSNPDYTSTKENLTAFIREQMGKDHVKGLSLALVDGDKVVWSEGFGFADEKNKVLATADTLYRIDFVSKLFTALEIMKLNQRGGLALDDPLTKDLPGFSIHSRFRHSKQITIRSLLADHSGLPADYHQGMWAQNPGSLAQLVRDLKKDYLVAPPQSFYKYSELDYSLLGRVIELKTRRPFDQAMRNDLLRPLGMNSSTFDVSPEVQAQMAKSYNKGDETAPLHLRDTPAGGMVSSANDMAKFLQFLFTDKPSLLKSKPLASMYTAQYAGLPLDFGHQVGLGWMLSGLGAEDFKALAWHDGDYGPYFCRVAMLRNEKLGVVVLSNTMESHQMAGETALRALKLMLQSKYGVPANLDKPKIVMPQLITVPVEKLNRYVGFYSGIGKAAEIMQGGSNLRANLMDHQFDLVPTAENKFIPRIMILFFPIHIPQYNVEFSTIAGKDVAILNGLGEPIVFEKIEPSPIPLAWRECLGKYRLDDPDGETQFKNMTLEDRNGLLTVNAKITSKIFNIVDTDYLINLEPISNSDAVISGLFYPDGDTVHVTHAQGRIRLYYAGLRFTKTDGADSTGKVASK